MEGHNENIFIDVIETAMENNNVIFIKLPLFLKEQLTTSMLKTFSNMATIDPSIRCLPGMSIKTYIKFLLKWNTYTNSDEIKGKIEEVLSIAPILDPYYVNLILNPNKIIITSITFEIMDNPSFYKALQIGQSLLEKKYIIFVDDLSNKHLQEFKTLDFSENKPVEKPNILKNLEGVSLTKNCTVFFSINDVFYFESINSIIYAQLKEDRIRIKVTLKKLENQLPNHFFRTHRCYLTNLHHLTDFVKTTHSSYEVLLKGYKVPLSKYRLKAFKNFIKSTSR